MKNEVVATISGSRERTTGIYLLFFPIMLPTSIFQIYQTRKRPKRSRTERKKNQKRSNDAKESTPTTPTDHPPDTTGRAALLHIRPVWRPGALNSVFVELLYRQ